MQKLIGFNIKRNKKILVSDIIKFYEVRGYTLYDADAKGMTFKRGSLWGNLFSLNPIKWKTKVDIEILKKERMDYDVYSYYHFSTFGQFTTTEEDLFFNEEVNAFSKAIQEFNVNVDELERLADKTSKSNISYMFKAFPIGIAIALIIIFFANLYFKDEISIIIATAITATCILGTYYIVVRGQNKI